MSFTGFKGGDGRDALVHFFALGIYQDLTQKKTCLQRDSRKSLTINIILFFFF